MPVKMPKKAAILKERDIERTCTEFLELDGWRCIKTDLPHLRGLGVQEKGMADRLYLRYGKMAPEIKQCSEMGGCGCAEVLWVEWKRPKGKVASKQNEWHELERAIGALTWIASIDFPPTIEGFRAHYMASGLARKVRA